VTITDRAKLTALAQPDQLIDGPDMDSSNAGLALPPISDGSAIHVW
jgi:CRP/FNR family transcriptional regulator, transcriptional activator FtrB